MILIKIFFSLNFSSDVLTTLNYKCLLTLYQLTDQLSKNSLKKVLIFGYFTKLK